MPPCTASCSAVPAAVPCGFIHLPLLRAQVAELLAQPGGRDLGQCASMEFPTLLKALEIALEISLGAAPRKARSKGLNSAADFSRLNHKICLSFNPFCYTDRPVGKPGRMRPPAAIAGAGFRGVRKAAGNRFRGPSQPQGRQHQTTMKLTIERAALLKALGHVQSVVERRNTIPDPLQRAARSREGQALR